MKKILLLAGFALFMAGAQAQTARPAAKTPAKTTATAKTPTAKPTSPPPAETPPAEPEPDRPAPALDENGWPIVDPNEKTEASDKNAKPATTKAGAKKPAAKSGAAAKGKTAGPAKPVVYLPAEFFYTLDAKPLESAKGLPEKPKGLLSISVKNSNRVEKENPKGQVKVDVTLIERTRPNEPKTKTITLGQAKQGIELQNFFGTAPKPGDQIKVALTNTKEPHVSMLNVQMPESAIFNIMVDGKKVDRKKGIPANSTGVFVIAPKGADKMKKVNADQPVELGVVLMRENKAVSETKVTLEEAQSGLLFEGLMEGAQPGDRILIDLKNTEEAHFANFPLL